VFGGVFVCASVGAEERFAVAKVTIGWGCRCHFAPCTEAVADVFFGNVCWWRWEFLFEGVDGEELVAFAVWSMLLVLKGAFEDCVGRWTCSVKWHVREGCFG
jgi:hypothetical protein